MKLVFLLLLLSVSLVSVVAADGCAIQNLCYNQDDMPFCAPTDANCTYLSYTLIDGTCVAAAEADSDGDGWSDTCDAFSVNASEWIDLDADLVGYNSDCDDLNASLTVCPDAIVTNGTTNESINQSTNENNNTIGNESATNSTTNKGNLSGVGNESTTNETNNNTATDDVVTASATDANVTLTIIKSRHVNNNVGEVILHPLVKENQSVPEPVVNDLVETYKANVTVAHNTSPTLQNVTLPTNLLTGNVVGVSSTGMVWLWIVIGLMCSLFLIIFVLRRRKEN